MNYFVSEDKELSSILSPIWDGDSMKNVEGRLNEYGFVRCNNCYLVNLRYVEGVLANSAIVAGDELQISRPRKKPFMDALAQQAARSLQFFFSSSQHSEVDHLLLAGGGAQIPGLSKLLQDNLGYRVTLANPFLRMGYAPQVDAKKIERNASSLLVACGLALRSFD